MIVGWLQDQSEYVGGAELTSQQFRDAAPEGVRIMDITPGSSGEGTPDVWVVHNVTQYGSDWIDVLSAAPVVKYWHDVGPHVNPRLREWLLGNARNVFCSPLQQNRMYRTLGDARGVCIPPAMDLQPFRDARQPERDGTVWIGNMVNHGKGLQLAVDWADRHSRTVRFYGDGPFRPQEGPHVKDWGPLPYDQVPDVLGRAEALLFLPTALEPFGRVVAEAWAAGCKIVTNELCGAAWWIENQPDALDSAAQEFWHIVCEAAA